MKTRNTGHTWDLKAAESEGGRRAAVTGAARYDHILVDEFQDINPLDLQLVSLLAQRNRATITIVGDDDQAIFEWRGASPEYILHPNKYFGLRFDDHQLAINYRSPTNIVERSQLLIANNKNRISKKVSAHSSANKADISTVKTKSVNERLELVTKIVRSSIPGRVAVIGRFRGQLLPYEVYFASDGAPFKTATDLDVFGSKAFSELVGLVQIWNYRGQSRRTAQLVDDTVAVCNLIRRRPFSKVDDRNVPFVPKRGPALGQFMMLWQLCRTTTDLN